MRKLVFGTLFAASLCAVGAFADEMTGYVSDAHCGSAHNTVSAKNTQCIVDKCLKGGADPVLVSNGKVIKFDADSKEKAKAFGGENVKIDGTMDGDMLKITSIDKAQ